MQQRLLVARVALTQAPAGLIVYCGCSLEPEEGPDIVRDVITGEARAQRLPVSAGEVHGLSDCITAKGDLRTLPCHLPNADSRMSGLDGFYAARLRRI